MQANHNNIYSNHSLFLSVNEVSVFNWSFQPANHSPPSLPLTTTQVAFRYYLALNYYLLITHLLEAGG
jgi:hypothetical protein